MRNLGILEDEQGDVGQARHWWQQAISTGHTDQAPAAMVDLGILEYQQGDVGQARHWYQQAISTGHTDWAPKAMVDLGILEYQQGDVGQARYWWQQAIGTGHTESTTRAEHELRTLDRRTKERQEGERFGRYGYLAYADPALMNQAQQLPTTPAQDPETDESRPGAVLQTFREHALTSGGTATAMC
jgi:tetratricopeptide (TPR) repeat protein